MTSRETGRVRIWGKQTRLLHWPEPSQDSSPGARTEPGEEEGDVALGQAPTVSVTAFLISRLTINLLAQDVGSTPCLLEEPEALAKGWHTPVWSRHPALLLMSALRSVTKSVRRKAHALPARRTRTSEVAAALAETRL